MKYNEEKEIRSVGRRPAAALLALMLGLLAGRALAANSAGEVLTISIGGSLDVRIDGVFSSTYTLGNASSGTALSPASTATVVNASSGLTEQWLLSVSTIAGGGNWAVIGSTGIGNNAGGGGSSQCVSNCPGLDQYGFQAMFVSSNTISSGCGAADPRWNGLGGVGATTIVTGTPTLYNSAHYADPTLSSGASGAPDQTGSINGTNVDGNMFAYSAVTGAGKRGLCARLIMPGAVSSGAQQTIQLTITGSPGL